MSVVQKKIQKLENRYRMITWRKRFLEAAAAGILIGTLILIAGLLKTEEFSVAISEVTDLYYEARQYPEDSKDREKCCMAAEKRLQRLSRNYGEKEQQHLLPDHALGDAMHIRGDVVLLENCHRECTPFAALKGRQGLSYSTKDGLSIGWQ